MRVKKKKKYLLSTFFTVQEALASNMVKNNQAAQGHLQYFSVSPLTPFENPKYAIANHE